MQAARGTPLTSDEAAGPETSTGGPLPRSRRGLWVAVALAAYAVDVTTKVLAVEHLTGRDPVPLLGQVLQLTLTRNPGASFSTGTGLTEVLSTLALAALVVVAFVARRVRSPLWALALGLLMGGIAGNFTDRLLRSPGPMRGHVVDFLQLPHWPIFNVADMCIDVGAALVVLQALRGIGVDGRRHESERAAS